MVLNRRGVNVYVTCMLHNRLAHCSHTCLCGSEYILNKIADVGARRRREGGADSAGGANDTSGAEDTGGAHDADGATGANNTGGAADEGEASWRGQRHRCK